MPNPNTFQVITQKRIFFVKNCWNPPFLSYRIVTYTKRKQIRIVISFISGKKVRYCGHTSQAWKCTARKHITSYYQNGFRTHIATCDLSSQIAEVRPHIASHALVNCMYLAVLFRSYNWVILSNMYSNEVSLQRAASYSF